jgi:chromosome segregation protein
MFKLQKLEITGFKSFADYTEVIFTGDGITAVVGPNGCGKSNVSESIAWVLGEQRAKTLRGAEMKDVIFQGTSKRKPSGMAEVVLHLVREDVPYHDEEELSDIDESLTELDEHAINAEDFEEQETEVIEIGEATENTGLATATAPAKLKTKRHWRPRNRAFDFAVGEAVSVTRRIYLSGESDYLLNGKTCRLRDIHDLFSGTGLSGTNYAIIEQGRIGQILSSKPSDRRNLIEEAAGISKFRTRQRAAETRLESAKGNLRRISDIVSEIDKQANSLRRQAAKTKRYKILREEFRELLKNVFTAEGKFLSDLVGELEAKLEKAIKTERELLVEVTTKDENFRSATQKAREAEENLAKIRQKHSENALQRDRLERDLVYKNEQIVSLKNRLEVLQGEISDTENRLKLIKSEVERLKKDEKVSSSEYEKEELSFRQIERSYQDKLNAVKQIEEELEKERGELTTHTAAVERFAEIERQLENTIERLSERIEGLRREGERAETSYIEHLQESEQLTKNLVEAKENLAKLNEEKTLLLANTNKTRENLRESEKNLAKIRENFSRTKHRLETLQELEEKRAIYAPSVQKLFAEEAKIGVKFLGTLADKLNVDSKAEKAVESIFGNYLQTVLVATETDAKKVAKYLNENNLGRLAILAIENKKAKLKRQKNSLLEFLGVDDDFASILNELFPREISAQVIESITDIDANSAENFVTFDGDLCFGGKLFISGKANTNEKNTSLLAFKRELRELSATYETLSKEINSSTNDVEKLRLILSEKESQIADKQQVIAKAEKDLLSQEIQSKTLKQETERAERHKKVVADETLQIERELGEIRVKQADAKENAKKAFSSKGLASEKLAEITKKLTDARIKIEAESSILSEKRALAATTAERRRSAQNALRRIESEQTELENRLARQTFEIKENEGKLNELTSAITEITRKTESAETDQESEQNELNQATENLKFSRERADAMSTELAELNQKSGEARNSRAELEVQQAETVTRLQNLNENCFQELNQTLIELVESNEIDADFALESEKKRVEDLRKRLEDFGAVNMLALEELAEAEERLLFLTSQRQDIIDSINSAEEALREIKRRSRERFREAFTAINEYFTEFFFELFGGGRGEMSLIEAEDILESGIEIVAQPPGKRLQNILLLSGGEKAMTAIALVMAIFKYRPSPFCILDEVDAPLDDANVGRFVDKIAQMSENTQFIVITHNKRTMEAAKALYGVTMEEAGVSKVVSVRFE